MINKFTISQRNWVYELVQDTETGDLSVESSKPLGPLRKAAGYLKAESSGLVGSVSLPVLEKRKAACDGCESAKKVEEGTWYCKSCGCPEWERSRLQVKWEMPAATCPLGKWPE